MTRTSGVGRWPARRVERALTTAMWGVLGIGLAVALLQGGLELAPSPTWLILTALLLFFLATIARIAVAAVAQPRPWPRVMLAVGLLLWAAGSLSISAGGDYAAATFPSPGEGFFLAAYALLATSLLFDVPRSRRAGSGAVWLDTTVVCAGAVTLAGAVVVTPIGNNVGSAGPELLLALLYPLLDVLLVLVVIAQLSLRQRPVSGATLSLGAGLVALAVADSTLIVSLSSRAYVTNVVIELLYGIAFALIVGGACARRSESAELLQPRTRGSALIGAAAVALLVLVLRPTGLTDWHLTLPALVTLVAAGARLVLAMRDAQDLAEAKRLSLTDELTGMPNRRAILAELDRRLPTTSPVALMLLDLDGFKEINDSLGHAAGDLVLIRVAARLVDWAGPGVQVARLGGDEFAAICPVADENELLTMASGLREALQRPLPVEGLHVEVRASVGIAVRGAKAVTSADLLRQSDVAMYEAKAARVGALTYDSSRDSFSRARLQSVADLRRGIADGELELWYQPQVDAATREVVSVEALVRWRHRERGLLLPVSFLPDARRSGLMNQLSEVVVDAVVADTVAWRRLGHTFSVAFNCAPPELLGGRVLPKLFTALARTTLPPGSMIVELTEDSFVADPERAREMLLHLRRHDVQASIDDYGTGFSSLAYLRDLPVQELKIDRSFISSVTTDPRSRVIVDSTRQMAHAMGLRVVAEGVEDAETAVELLKMGIDVLQGYHIARPMPAAEVHDWVEAWTAGRRGSDVLSFRRLTS